MKKTGDDNKSESSVNDIKITPIKKSKKDAGVMQEKPPIKDVALEEEEDDDKEEGITEKTKPVNEVISPPAEVVQYFELEQLNDIDLDKRLVLWNDKGAIDIGLKKVVGGKNVITKLNFKLIGTVMFEASSGEGKATPLKNGAKGKPKLSVTICTATPHKKVVKAFPKIVDDVKRQFNQLQKITNAILDFKVKNPSAHSKIYNAAHKIAKGNLKKLPDDHPKVLAKLAEEFRHPKAGFYTGFTLNSEYGPKRYGYEVDTIRAGIEPYTRATPKSEAYRAKQHRYEVMNKEIQEAANDPNHEYNKLAKSVLNKMTVGVMTKKKDSDEEELQKMFFSQIEVFDPDKTVHYKVFDRKTTSDSFIQMAVSGDIFNTDESDGITWRLQHIIPIYKAPYVPYNHEEPKSDYAIPKSGDSDDEEEGEGQGSATNGNRKPTEDDNGEDDGHHDDDGQINMKAFE